VRAIVDDTSVSPLVILLMFVSRCLVPLAVMLGISYLLRRLGLIRESPPEPEESYLVEVNHQTSEGTTHYG
jgi:hypothetical protein